MIPMVGHGSALEHWQAENHWKILQVELVRLLPLVGSGIVLAHREAERQVEEVGYQSECKPGVVKGFYMRHAPGFDQMPL
jgi:hypothetical protein